MVTHEPSMWSMWPYPRIDVLLRCEMEYRAVELPGCQVKES